jgi:hypothetical protein
MTTRIRVALAAAAVLLPVSGCLEAPGIEETWTRLDLETPAPFDSVAVGDSTAIVVHGEITYRSILTGGIIADVRVAPGIPPAEVRLGPDAPRMRMLQDVDRILAGSTLVGRAVIPFTGWDHLIQNVDADFSCLVPPDSTGGGVYLVVYLADIDEVELPGGGKRIDVTPYDFEAQQVLPTGAVLVPGGGP